MKIVIGMRTPAGNHRRFLNNDIKVKISNRRISKKTSPINGQINKPGNGRKSKAARIVIPTTNPSRKLLTLVLFSASMAIC